MFSEWPSNTASGRILSGSGSVKSSSLTNRCASATAASGFAALTSTTIPSNAVPECMVECSMTTVYSFFINITLRDNGLHRYPSFRLTLFLTSPQRSDPNYFRCCGSDCPLEVSSGLIRLLRALRQFECLVIFQCDPQLRAQVSFRRFRSSHRVFDRARLNEVHPDAALAVTI